MTNQQSTKAANRQSSDADRRESQRRAEVKSIAQRMAARRSILERAAGVTDETINIEFGGI